MNLFLKKFKRRFIFKDRLTIKPTVFLSLILIFTITFLTGMCTIFPKKKILIYDGKEKVGYIHLNNEESLNYCVNEYLKTLGKEIKKQDTTKVEKLSNGNYEFKINRGVNVNLNLFGEEKIVYLKQNQTVEDLLKDLKIDINDPKIYVSPDLDTVLKENDSVLVKTCEIKIKNENFQLVDLPEEKVEDSKLEQGKTVVRVKPVPRKIRKYVECKYVNSKLVEEKQKEEIVENGVAKKIAIGKRVKEQKQKELEVKAPQLKKEQPKKPQNKNKQEKKQEEKKQEDKKPEEKLDLSNKKILCGYSTAYVAKGRTARLGPARFGVVAVNPKVIPYGTKLFIEGYGTCVAGDKCGAACKGKVLVDVCFKTKAQCKAWGKRRVKIHIL